MKAGISCKSIALSAVAAIGMMVVGATTALADSCRDEIAALYDGGTLDSFARPRHRQIKRVYSTDGDLKFVFDAVIESPLAIKSGVRESGQFFMAIGNKTWMGPTLDGPWTASTDMPGDMEAAQRQVVTSQQANLEETECLGTTERDGSTYLTYRFRTKTDPSPERGNSWWGSLDTIWLDPETRQVAVWELTEHLSSWAPDLNMDKHVIEFEYDPEISVSPPQ
jgi:hypothetical protein